MSSAGHDSGNETSKATQDAVTGLTQKCWQCRATIINAIRSGAATSGETQTLGTRRAHGMVNLASLLARRAAFFQQVEAAQSVRFPPFSELRHVSLSAAPQRRRSTWSGASCRVPSLRVSPLETSSRYLPTSDR